MRPEQGRDDVVVTLCGKDGFEAELGHALFLSPLADGGRRLLAAKKRSDALGVPRAALVLADATRAGRKQRVANRVESLCGHEHDELAVHALTFTQGFKRGRCE